MGLMILLKMFNLITAIGNWRWAIKDTRFLGRVDAGFFSL